MKFADALTMAACGNTSGFGRYLPIEGSAFIHSFMSNTWVRIPPSRQLFESEIKWQHVHILELKTKTEQSTTHTVISTDIQKELGTTSSPTHVTKHVRLFGRVPCQASVILIERVKAQNVLKTEMLSSQ